MTDKDDQNAGQNNTNTGDSGASGQGGGDAGSGGDAGAGDAGILNGGDSGDTGGDASGDQGGDQSSGKDAGDKGGDDTGDDSGAPDSYEAFTMPEGLEIDQPIVDAVSPVFKEANLSQGQAQKVLDAYNDVVATRQADDAAANDKVVNDWVKEITDDKDFGGEKFDETSKLANKALKQFGSDDLVGVLRRTGLCNHPEFIKAFARVGATIQEDGGPGSGSGDGGSEKTPAEKMYG